MRRGSDQTRGVPPATVPPATVPPATVPPAAGATRTRRWPTLLTAGFALGALFWLGFAWWIMPALVRNAYSGEGWLPLVALIKSQAAARPVELFVARWYDVAAVGLLLWTVLALLALPASRRFFVQRIIGTARSSELGLIRVIVCSTAAWFALDLPLARVVARGSDARVSMGIVDGLYALGLGGVLDQPLAAWGLQSATVALLLVAAAGWRTRWTVPLAALLYLILAGLFRAYTKFSHSGLYFVYVLIVLACTRCGDGFSLDRRQRDRQSRPEADLPQPRYAWGRWFVWLVIALPYLAAGLSKLRNGGWTWWDSTNMQAIVLDRFFHPEEMNVALLDVATALPPFVFALAGLATLAVELGMVATLFSRPARFLLPTAAAAMHVGIALVMDVEFWDLVLLQFVFYDWRAIWLWIGKYTGRRLDAAAPAPANGRVSQQPGYAVALRCGALLGVLALFLGAWSIRLERYPLTAMQMFSSYQGTGVITYARPYQVDNGGEVSIAPLRAMGVSSSGYRSQLRRGFAGDEERAALTDELRAIGQRYNKSLPVDERIQTLRVVLYEWDFVERRDEAAYGEAVARIDVPLRER